MAVKEKFLSYVEMQRSARNYREVYGIDDPRTTEAYEKANVLKRQVLEMIEELENENV
jgi:hypothetical protein